MSVLDSPRMSVVKYQVASEAQSASSINHQVILRLVFPEYDPTNKIYMAAAESTNIYVALHRAFKNGLEQAVKDGLKQANIYDVEIDNSYPKDSTLMQALHLVFHRIDETLDLREQEKPIHPDEREKAGGIASAFLDAAFML
jgi:hypothetical protein